MAKVGIVMGSDSDMPIMAKAADVLKELGSTSSRNVCRNLPNASYWYSNEDI